MLGCLVGRPAGWLVGWLLSWLMRGVGCLAAWFGGRLVGWLAGLVGWLAVWLAGCFGTISFLTHFIKFCTCYVEFKIHGCRFFKNTVEAA
jgi:hypothetical protein